MRDDDVAAFEDVRPALMGLAYRILGSSADAADAVQDTYVAWHQADRASIRSPRAWLITVCSRRCVDLATAASRARVDYVGTWLPEPVHTTSEDTPEEQVALASSVTTAFLLLLERLTPKERAAYVLREVFDFEYPQVAGALELSEAACRQLVARARRNVGRPAVRHHTPPARQRELLDAFRGAIHGRAPDAFARLLADDVALTADGGGRVAAVLETLAGPVDVLEFVGCRLAEYWRELKLVESELNAGAGLEIWDDGELSATVSFDLDNGGLIRHIFIVRNPDKLERLARTPDVLA
jgi:RNA polymerase sigma-70 factor (ECF subfamily)